MSGKGGSGGGPARGSYIADEKERARRERRQASAAAVAGAEVGTTDDAGGTGARRGGGAGSGGRGSAIADEKERARRERQEASSTAVAAGVGIAEDVGSGRGDADAAAPPPSRGSIADEKARHRGSGAPASRPGAQSVMTTSRGSYGQGRLAAIKSMSADGQTAALPPPLPPTSSPQPTSSPGAHRGTYGQGRLAIIKSADARSRRGGDAQAPATTPATAAGAAISGPRSGESDTPPELVNPDEAAKRGASTKASAFFPSPTSPEAVADAAAGKFAKERVDVDPTVIVSNHAAQQPSFLKATESYGDVILGEVGKLSADDDGGGGVILGEVGQLSDQESFSDEENPPRGGTALPLTAGGGSQEESFPSYEVVQEDAAGGDVMEGPAVARAVPDDEIEADIEADAAIAYAIAHEPAPKVPFRKTRKCRLFGCAGLCLVVAAVIGAVVGTTVGGGGGGTPPVPSPTPEPTAAPTPFFFTQTVTEFLEGTVGDKINVPGTPYNQALLWIDSEDPQNLTTRDSTLLRRYLLAVMYFSTIQEGGEGWRNCGKDPSTDTCTADRDEVNGGPANDFESIRWLSGEDECDWMGVDCRGEVLVDIVVTVNNLHGTLVPELAMIETLQGLRLSQNRITGTIPSEYGSFSQLLILELYRNEITGTFPAELYDAPLLQRLQVAHNGLSGDLPPPGSGSTDSRYTKIILANNSLTGPVPPELGNLPMLKALDLAINAFTGTIPSRLAELPNLESLTLEENSLVGSMPQEICDLGLTCLTADPEVQCDCCTNANCIP